jgi:hypothetical protein
MCWFRRGRRLMSVGSLVLLAIATMHTVMYFSPLPDEPGLAEVVRSMEEFHMDAVFGMRPSVAEISWTLSLMLSVFMATLGAANLVVLGHPSTPPAVLRGLAAVNVISMAALIVDCLVHQFPPPAIAFALAGVIFLIALVLPARRPASD